VFEIVNYLILINGYMMNLIYTYSSVCLLSFLSVTEYLFELICFPLLILGHLSHSSVVILV
jgi:hypothetical protein